MTTTPDTPILTARGLGVGYGDRALLPPLSFSVLPGEQWVVVGRNGGGKSTLLRTLLGLLPPVSGQVERPTGTTLAYVPQRYPLDPTVPVRAIDLVAEGLESGWSFLRPLRPPGARTAIQEALSRVGIEHLATQRFNLLSEGQKQRVLLARALVGRPSLILLDEPTSAMDLLAEQQTLEILDGLRRDLGTSVMLVSHHLEATLALATQAIFVDAEHATVAVGAVADILSDPTFRLHFGGLVDTPGSGCGPEGHTHG